MALTQEQLDTLETGTPIVIHTTFDHFDCDGDVRYKAPYSLEEEHYSYIDPKYVSLPGETVEQPTPKHGLSRLFRKGDKATPRIVNGRKPVCGIDGVAAKINSVELIVESNEGERENGTVDIKFPCGTIGQIDPVYLELVTPVEELEPYIIREYADFYAVEKDGAQYSIFFKGSYHANAKAAAEAECKRLNDEWKQSHQN